LILKHFPTLLLIRNSLFDLDCARTVHESVIGQRLCTIPK